MHEASLNPKEYVAEGRRLGRRESIMQPVTAAWTMLCPIQI